MINYLAFVLDNPSRHRLMMACPPSFPEVLCHHMTIVNDVSKPEFPELMTSMFNARIGVGMLTPVLVIGHAKGPDIECFACTHDRQPVRADGSFYHITLSKRDNVRSVTSNLLMNDVGPWRGIFPVYGRYEILQREPFIQQEIQRAKANQ